MHGTLRRTREFKGTGVGGLAVVAKGPSDLPPEHLILKLREDNERRKSYQDVLDVNRRSLHRAKFEDGTDARIRRKTIEQKTQRILDERETALEQRRAKLRALLAREEESYGEFVEASVETPIEKMARMREQVKQLREAREQERLVFVKDMEDQAWKNNCDPLRGARNRQVALATNEHHRVQMREKEMLSQMEAERDQMYDELWEGDRVAKERREKYEEHQRQIEMQKTTEVLMEQIAMQERNRHQEKLNRETEQRLRLEEARMMEEEDRLKMNDKINAQRRFKSILDKDAAERQAYAETISKEDMAADLQLLEEIESERKNTKELAQQRKMQLKREAMEYLEFLQQMRELNKQREADRDAFIDEEGRRARAKQNSGWREHKAKRIAMMNDVIATRREQIRLRKEENERERQQILEEGKRIEADLELLQMEQEASHHDKLQKGLAYGKELEEQKAEHSKRLALEREQEKAFERMIVENDKKMNARIDRELGHIQGLSISGSSF
eukprot:m.1454369 g.1454369  ORF g.1454369 m.1454369 type:complete len:503 (-) comp25119_c0_seq14:262-1770(-)